MNEPSPECPGQADECQKICRRRFLEWTVRLGVATVAAGIVTPAAVYLWPVRREGPGQEFVSAGPAGDLAVGASKLVQVDGKAIVVIRPTEKDYRAFSAVCTHLACLVHWRKDKADLYCPCHGGQFDIDGQVIGGPPPRPLPRYPVSIVDGDLRVQPGSGT